jgi:hypothetical protein
MTDSLLGISGLNPTLSRIQWEDAVVTEADYFTVIDYHGLGHSKREEYPTLRQAIGAARTKGRPILYAIHKSGRSTMVAPADYERLLILRKET